MPMRDAQQHRGAGGRRPSGAAAQPLNPPLRRPAPTALPARLRRQRRHRRLPESPCPPPAPGGPARSLSVSDLASAHLRSCRPAPRRRARLLPPAGRPSSAAPALSVPHCARPRRHGNGARKGRAPTHLAVWVPVLPEPESPSRGRRRQSRRARACASGSRRCPPPQPSG